MSGSRDPGLVDDIDWSGYDSCGSIADSGLLTAAEEVELAKRIEAGLYARHLIDSDDSRYDRRLLAVVAGDGERAFVRFVEANHRLAAWWARRGIAGCAVYRRHCTVEDLTHEGVLGVIRAVRKFDFTQGYKFSTYASWWIRVFQQRAVMSALHVGLSRRDYQRASELVMVYPDLTARLGHAPTAGEVAAELGTTVADVAELHTMLAPAVSLDAPVGEGSWCLGDTLAEHATGAGGAGAGGAADLWPTATALIATLSAREQSLLREIFGLADGRPRSVAEVARARRLPAQTVSALLQAALVRLQSAAQTTKAAA